MNLETQATIHIAKSPAEVFAAASSTENLPKIFPGKGPIPGVVSAAVVGGGAIAVGAVRRVKTTDGAELEESYIEYDPPHRYAYQMTKLKPPLSYLMTVATGRWVLTPSNGGTDIVWTYSCALTNPVMFVVAAPVIKIFMRQAMQRCLELLKAGLG